MQRIRLDRAAVQLTLYVAEPHMGDRRLKVDELLRRAASRGASGATVIAAYQDFGRRRAAGDRHRAGDGWNAFVDAFTGYLRRPATRPAPLGDGSGRRPVRDGG